MHEAMEKTRKLCEMRGHLEEFMCPQVVGNSDALNVEQAGEFIDMIKDLCEAEKDIWKACYYRSVVEAMQEYDGDICEGDGRYGYDNWRYSSGRFAPKGRGHYAGYRPMGLPEPITGAYVHDMTKMAEEMMPRHYSDGRMDNTHRMSSNPGRGTRPDYGSNYQNYQESRRHYTETGSTADKNQMDMSARQHISDAANSMRDIWSTADPELKRELKNDLTSLLGEMNV